MKVCKFGGSSLANADRVGQVCDIVAADPERRLVVVSAPGKRDDGDTKVTDLLIACAEARLAGRAADAEVAAVVARYEAIREALQLPAALTDEIRVALEAVVGGDATDPAKYMDAVKAAGEDNSARLVAAELSRRGLSARYLFPGDAGLLLSDEYGNAQLLPESYDNLAALKDAEGVTVFPGFFGTTRGGDIVTFPRGGSDITGSILAAAVGAEVYENFTDVDSVFAADPRIVPHAAPISELTFREMRELSYAGFGVLHDEAIIPSVQAGIPICVKNTARPELPGTRIVLERRHRSGHAVGIASDDGFCTIFIGKYLMNREVGFGRRMLQILEEEGLSYEHSPSGIDNLSVILREEGLDTELERHVLGRLRDELAASEVSIEYDLALIMVVGEGMRYSVGLAARAAKALADADVNVEMMNQGASEISIMFGVKAVDRRRAVRSLYDALFEPATSEPAVS